MNDKKEQEIVEYSILYQVSIIECKKCHFLLINKKECYCEAIESNK